MGTDVDFCRMFDQYLYKRTENLDLSLSVPHAFNGYMASDQTFHTPSFGDEEFDIPPLHHGGAGDGGNAQQQMSGYAQQPQMGMSCPPPGGDVSYQQPLYLSEHSLGMSSSPGYGSPQQQQSGYGSMGGGNVGSPGMMQHHMQPIGMQQMNANAMQYGNSPPHTLHQLQPQQQQQHPMSHMQQHQMQQIHGNPSQQMPMENTTSEDSDDSGFLQQQHHSAMMAGLKRPSPEPAESPTGMGGSGKAAAAKKAKGTKKKKKRDPNEPQKPVSAYALFFRDTQAAIKGQNPTASFGEVSKIVASMWDALDAEHKNVYKKKTEAAKKEYLKALALYRASLVSKGASESEVLYPGYPPATSSPSAPSHSLPTSGSAPHPPPSSSNQHPPPPPFYPFSSPPSSSSSSPPSHQNQGQLSPLAKKPSPNFLQDQQQQQQQQAMMLGSMARGSMQQQNLMQGGQQGGYMQQDGMVHQGYHLSPAPLLPPSSSLPPPPSPSTPNSANMMSNSPPMHHHMHQAPQHHHQVAPNQPSHQDENGGGMVGAGGQMVSGGSGNSSGGVVSSSPSGQQQGGGGGGGNQGGNSGMQMEPLPSPNACIRVGCPNQAVPNSEWEDEYCSNECVVSHCRDVFSSWVASNQGTTQSYNAVK